MFNVQSLFSCEQVGRVGQTLLFRSQCFSVTATKWMSATYCHFATPRALWFFLCFNDLRNLSSKSRGAEGTVVVYGLWVL